MTIEGTPLRDLIREVYGKVNEDNIFNGAAALGFYLTLAIFLAVVLAMSLIPYLPIQHVGQAFMDLLRQALPGNAAQMFTQVVTQVTSRQSGSLVSTGALATLWATSTGMYAIMQQLNVTYGVKEGRSFFRARAVALGLSLLFTALLLTAFSLIVLGGIAQSWIGGHLGLGPPVLAVFAVLRWVIIVGALMLAFSMAYYLAPNVRAQRFRFITVGSVTATVLLLVASAGLATYVQDFSDYSALYGGISAVVALMLWLYLAGLSLLAGSVVNVVLERHAGRLSPVARDGSDSAPRGQAAGVASGRDNQPTNLQPATGGAPAPAAADRSTFHVRQAQAARRETRQRAG